MKQSKNLIWGVLLFLFMLNGQALAQELHPTELVKPGDASTALNVLGQLNKNALSDAWSTVSKPVIWTADKLITETTYTDNVKKETRERMVKNILLNPNVVAYRANIANQIYRKALLNGASESVAKGERNKALEAFDNGVTKTLNSYIGDNEWDTIGEAADKTIENLTEKSKKFYEDVENYQKNEGLSETAAIEKAARNEVEVIASEVRECPTIEQLKQKYQAGCWSCLVVEKLVSSFLNAASGAYGLAQRAGLTVLMIGSVMWILMWGLKNMASFTQLEPGNILNDLIKFAFKVLVAYVFIISGLKMVSSYFINPIMGTGAIVAQQFWADEILVETEDYKWDTLTDEEYAEVDMEVQKAIADSQIITPIPQKAEEVTIKEYTPEERAKIAASLANSKGFTEEAIPNFLIPGTTTGMLSSPFGCRKPPTAGSSKAHKGIDIKTGGKPGPVVAAGPGKITYRTQSKNGQVSGAGHYAIIVHDKKWVSKYFHMTKSSLNFTSGEVAQGQQIGIIGNSGVGTGVHLHFEILYKNRNVDPLSLSQGKIIVLNESTCTGTNITPFPKGFAHSTPIPGQGWPAAGKGIFDLSSTYVTTGISSSGTNSVSMDYSSLILEPLGDIKYTGKTDILSKSVMNSILGATKVITSTMAESMILGNAITCYSTQEKGGAWKFGGGWKTLWTNFYITNFWMWIEGAAIWCCGFMLTLAVAYYLLDICFKLGFAVIALPIVMGLWPFNMTKGKFMICISIMFKSAATFAFLAITTSYAMNMISAALAGTDGGDGLTKMYEALEVGYAADADNIKFVADRLAIFGSYFIILLFAFIYSFKLIGAAIPQFVDKFFPDNAFGSASPMHHMATMATKYIKDKAMAPAKLARDVALHQTGMLAKGVISRTAGAVRKAAGLKDKRAPKVTVSTGSSDSRAWIEDDKKKK